MAIPSPVMPAFRFLKVPPFRAPAGIQPKVATTFLRLQLATAIRILILVKWPRALAMLRRILALVQ
jgi:hypothetical protein